MYKLYFYYENERPYTSCFVDNRYIGGGPLINNVLEIRCFNYYLYFHNKCIKLEIEDNREGHYEPIIKGMSDSMTIIKHVPRNKITLRKKQLVMLNEPFTLSYDWDKSYQFKDPCVYGEFNEISTQISWDHTISTYVCLKCKSCDQIYELFI